jgi:hypothetical protein
MSDAHLQLQADKDSPFARVWAEITAQQPAGQGSRLAGLQRAVSEFSAKLLKIINN